MSQAASRAFLAWFRSMNDWASYIQMLRAVRTIIAVIPAGFMVSSLEDASFEVQFKIMIGS